MQTGLRHGMSLGKGGWFDSHRRKMNSQQFLRLLRSFLVSGDIFQFSEPPGIFLIRIHSIKIIYYLPLSGSDLYI